MSKDLFGSVNKMDEDGAKFGRRRFIVALGVATAGLAGYGYIRSLPEKYMVRKLSFITPNEEFYNVAVNMFYRPDVDLNSWRLNLIDLNGKSSAISLDEIKQLPNKVVTRTLSCIGNTVGWPTVSNAGWRVVSLRELLEPIMTDQREGIRLFSRALDGYYSSIPLEWALDDESYLAYEMNGEPLPAEHGKPVRLLIPGRYGMKQPKWLKSMEITNRKVTGYWEEQNWSDDAEIKSFARLDQAKNIETAGEDIVLAGIAFAGRYGVKRVEVSVDGGKHWQDAHLESPTLKNSWSIWKYFWKRPVKGEYEIVCRMIDENDNKQIEKYADWFPSGCTGLHKVKLKVV